MKKNIGCEPDRYEWMNEGEKTSAICLWCVMRCNKFDDSCFYQEYLFDKNFSQGCWVTADVWYDRITFVTSEAAAVYTLLKVT